MKNKQTIQHEFGQGFYFGWTFGLGMFLASMVALFLIKILGAMGMTFF